MPPIHYVPDELCVVVTVGGRDADTVPELRDDDHERIYAGVLDHLAATLPILARKAYAAASRDDPFERDLAPLRRAALDGGRGPLLRPLARFARAVRGDSPLRPWVALPGADGSLTVLYFCQIGAADAPAEATNQRMVRDLVNLLNRHQRQQRIPFRAGDVPGPVRIVGATPNWLTGAAQIGYIGGSPGSAPAPGPTTTPPSDFGRFRFDHPAITQLVDDQRNAAKAQAGERSSVVVAILDTCPPRKAVAAKAADLQAAGRDNWLLREVAEHVRIDDPTFYDEDYERHFLVNWGERSPWGGDPASPDPGSAHYEMPDHGLFATGIIRDIAPAAEIHLIRALDKRGVGDLLGLAQILRLLPDALLGAGSGRAPNRERHLVVNLSLMVDLPPAEELLDLWFAHSARDMKTLRARWTDICATLDIIRVALDAVIAWLGDRPDILVVAAAGNDGQRYAARPAPGLPARYDTVLGVAATTAADVPARFSNRGDFVVLGNGVAVYGGEVEGAAPGELGTIANRPDGRPDAVVGIFSADGLPLSGDANGTGWAYWAGTSFATPVISALAANLWAAEPTLLPRDLIARITTSGPLPDGGIGFAATDLAALDCATILARQTI